MEITTNPSAQATVKPASEKNTGLTSDYEMFLKMLTTQMTNQDPLNPVDSSDYAVQLATFSSVEQQVLTNDLLTELTERLTGTGLAELGSWVGRDVRSTAPTLYSGSPVTINTEGAKDAAQANVDVYDDNRTLVASFAIDPQAASGTWDGTLQSGSQAPQGLYEYRLRLTDSQGNSSEAAAESYGRITEAKRGDDGTILVLEGGSEISTDSISGVRQ